MRNTKQEGDTRQKGKEALIWIDKDGQLTLGEQKANVSILPGNVSGKSLSALWMDQTMFSSGKRSAIMSSRLVRIVDYWKAATILKAMKWIAGGIICYVRSVCGQGK